MKHLLTASLWSALALTASADELSPNPKWQESIRDVIHAEQDEDETAALDRLTELMGRDYETLVRQLLYYSWQADSTRDGMAMGLMSNVMRIPEDSMLRALVPLLESSDAGLRKEVAGVLSQFEHETVDRPPSLACYREFLDLPIRAGGEPPPGLVRYLYSRDPGSALILLMRVHQVDREVVREILWADHVIADTLWKQRFGFLPKDQVEPAAREQFDVLSAHPRWWARLYAARIMQESEAFRDRATIDRLAGDRHALVREVAIEVRGAEAESTGG